LLVPVFGFAELDSEPDLEPVEVVELLVPGFEELDLESLEVLLVLVIL